MAQNDVVEHTKHGRVSVLSMNHRPHNLVGWTLTKELLRALDAAKASGSTAIILRSSLRHFSAGAEIEMFEQVIKDKSEFPTSEFVNFLQAFETFSLPIISSIHGICLGGGFELALATDFIIASASSKIGSVEAALGLHPLMGAIQRTTQRAGVLRAKEMALLGRRYDPATLEKWGLINLVCQDEELDETTMTIAQEIAHGPTVAHIATKKLAYVAVNEGTRAADLAMHEIQKQIWTSDDLKAALAAYRNTGVGSTKFEGC